MAQDDYARDGGGASTAYHANGRANGTSFGPADGVHGGPVDEATFTELVGRLINDFSDLVDRQIELAKQEVREEIGDVIGAAKTLAIGAGIAAVAGLMLLIWAWTGVIWFFNWLGALLLGPWGGWIGWLVGLIIPAIAGLVAWKGFIGPGIKRVKIKPLAKTRATLKEDLEWVQQLKTPSTR